MIRRLPAVMSLKRRRPAIVEARKSGKFSFGGNRPAEKARLFHSIAPVAKERIKHHPRSVDLLSALTPFFLHHVPSP